MDLEKITLEVCRIARETGAYLRSERRGFNAGSVIEKNTHDYVSYVDREAERMTVARLRELLPGAGFVTEEGTVEQSDAGLKWIVDPLDGTSNFIRDIAPFCVSIALWDGDEPLSGVVYEVCRDECYWAWRGGGAWLDGAPVRVSEKGMDGLFAVLDFPYEVDRYKPVLRGMVDRLYGSAASIRFYGSTAASLCYVAAGRFDVWAEAFIKPWDYAAGIVIVREAGGVVTDFNGRHNISGTHHLVATNAVVCDGFRSMMDLGKAGFD